MDQFQPVTVGLMEMKTGWPCLREECFYHEIHAADIDVHGEVPVFFLTVQNGAMMDKSGTEETMTDYFWKLWKSEFLTLDTA